jgi:hypothetical protein
MTPLERQKEFHKELKDLLRKYKAEIMIEDFGLSYGYHGSDNKIVVDFEYDESFFEEHNTGIIPQLILGTYENGSI